MFRPAEWAACPPFLARLGSIEAELIRSAFVVEDHVRDVIPPREIAGPPRVYIAGPMTGLPEFNVPAFHAAAAWIRALGYVAVNPAELNPDPTLDWHLCMRTDLRALVQCEALVVLPGWEHSRGATIEVRIARVLGLPVVPLAQVVSKWVQIQKPVFAGVGAYFVV